MKGLITVIVLLLAVIAAHGFIADFQFTGTTGLPWKLAYGVLFIVLAIRLVQQFIKKTEEKTQGEIDPKAVERELQKQEQQQKKQTQQSQQKEKDS